MFEDSSFVSPCFRDRVVQGALKLILEPIFEADFQPGSFGFFHALNDQANDCHRRQRLPLSAANFTSNLR
jgi:hypothetical protein